MHSIFHLKLLLVGLVLVVLCATDAASIPKQLKTVDWLNPPSFIKCNDPEAWANRVVIGHGLTKQTHGCVYDGQELAVKQYWPGSHRSQEFVERRLKWDAYIATSLNHSNIARNIGSCYTPGQSAVMVEPLQPDLTSVADVDMVLAMENLIDFFKWMDSRHLILCDMHAGQFGFDKKSGTLKLFDFDSLIELREDAPPLRSNSVCSLDRTNECHGKEEPVKSAHAFCYDNIVDTVQDFRCDASTRHCFGIDGRTQVYASWKRVFGVLKRPVERLFGKQSDENDLLLMMLEAATRDNRDDRWTWSRLGEKFKLLADAARVKKANDSAE